MSLLIDECLSPELAKMARVRGYPEASHVVWLGWGGMQDWELRPRILRDDWIFVTRNSYDFRGPIDAPGSRGQYAGIDLHAGLICLNGPPGTDLDMQKELFEQVLVELAANPDMVNQVLEVTLEEDEIHVLRYRMPDGD